MKANKQLLFILLLFSLNHVNSQSWTKVQLTPSPSLLQGGVFFQDTGIIIGAGIFKSNDYFQSFIIDSTYDTSGLHGVSFANHSTGYISTSIGSVFKTLDGGNTWYSISNGQPLNLLGFNVLLFISPDTGYAGSSLDENLFTTTNGGLTWASIDSLNPFIGSVLAIKVIHDSILYVLAHYGDLNLVRSSDYGQTWSVVSTIYNPTTGYADFYFLDDTTIILSMDKAILKSVNAGLTFDIVMLTADVYAAPGQAIIFSGHDTGFAAFSKSIYETYNGGNTWTNLNFSFAPDDSFNYIHFIALACSQNVVVGCARGDIYKMEPGCGITGIADITNANSFTLYPNPTNNKLYGTINYQQKSNLRRSPTDLQILAIDGREVIPPLAIQQNHFEVDVTNLAPGLYFLVLQNDEGRAVRKFVKE